MGRKAGTPEETPLIAGAEEGLLSPEGESPEEIEDRVVAQMRELSTSGEENIEYWLYRANEKNKVQKGSFIKRYTPETPPATILEEARDGYGGGNFILVARIGGRIRWSSPISVDSVPMGKGKDEKTAQAVNDPFEVLALSMNRAMSLSEARKLVALNNEAENAKGRNSENGMILLFSTLMDGMQKQSAAMMSAFAQLASAQRTAAAPPVGMESLLSAIKIGAELSGGKVPGADEEEGLIGLLKPMLPQLVPILLKAFGTATPAVAPGARALPAHTGAAVSPKPPPPPGAAEGAAAAPAAAVPEPMAQRRYELVVAEIAYALSFPALSWPELFPGLGDYIDGKFPGSLEDLKKKTDEEVAVYIKSLYPAFAERLDFFLAFRDYLKKEEEENNAGRAAD